MPSATLAELVEDLEYSDLPDAWKMLDLESFSGTKRLYTYQRRALEAATKALWKYFAGHDAASSGFDAAAAQRWMIEWYRSGGARTDAADIELKADLAERVGEFLPLRDTTLPFSSVCNRAGFWMATGSGKTLLIVKMVEILARLIRRGAIPPREILILCSRDDLLEQVRAHISEFNAAHRDLFLKIRELREHPEVRRHSPSLLDPAEVQVFLYRSDNLGEEQKERIVDFRNYESGGNWYLLLDEAHKGGKDSSRPQQIVNILARNGFLFNFSATFTEHTDILTTVANFNLAEYTRAGFGKRVCVLKRAIAGFSGTDWDDRAKRIVVAKALLLLTYLRRKAADLPAGYYHRPLLLCLVNSVNARDADLKRFFRELAQFGTGNLPEEILEMARADLGEDLEAGSGLLFGEGGAAACDRRLLEQLALADVLEAVFNSRSPADTEILISRSNGEFALKLKSASRPYALVRIGEAQSWVQDELLQAGAELSVRAGDESFFSEIEHSDVNILLGSRAFYEGWDSCRPNVALFINIGTGTDARKFILQAVGRGVRIQPLPGQRQRLAALAQAGTVSGELFESLRDRAAPLESLYVMGTNPKALELVLSTLEAAGRSAEGVELALPVARAVRDLELRLPVYRESAPILTREALASARARFPLAGADRQRLAGFLAAVPDDRVVQALFDALPAEVAFLRRLASDPEAGLREGQPTEGPVELLVSRVLAYFRTALVVLAGFVPVQDCIRHHRHIRVPESTNARIREAVAAVSDPGQDPSTPFVEVESEGSRLNVEAFEGHYYRPLLYADRPIPGVRHVIETPSEVQFLGSLRQYLAHGPGLERFAWSRIDASLDEVYVPYHDVATGALWRFKPGFVLWFARGTDAFVVFVESRPARFSQIDAKLAGFRSLFENDRGEPLAFPQPDGQILRVLLRFFGPRAGSEHGAVRRYRVDSVEAIVQGAMAIRRTEGPTGPGAAG